MSDVGPREQHPNEDRMSEERHPIKIWWPEGCLSSSDWRPEEHHPGNGRSPEDLHPNKEHHPSNGGRRDHDEQQEEEEARGRSPLHVDAEVPHSLANNEVARLAGPPTLVPATSSSPGTSRSSGTPRAREPVQAIHGFGYDATQGLPRVPPPFTLPKWAAEGLHDPVAKLQLQAGPRLEAALRHQSVSQERRRVAELARQHQQHLAGPQSPQRQEIDRTAAEHARLSEPALIHPHLNAAATARLNDVEVDAQQPLIEQNVVAAMLQCRGREKDPGDILGFGSGQSSEKQTAPGTELPNPQEEELWQTVEVTIQGQDSPLAAVKDSGGIEYPKFVSRGDDGLCSDEKQQTCVSGVDTQSRPHGNTCEGTEEPKQRPGQQSHGEASDANKDSILLQRQQQPRTPQGSPDSLKDTREAQAMVDALREFDVQISTKGSLKKSTLQAVSKSKYLLSS